MEIRRTEVFIKWLNGVSDHRAVGKILVRIERISAGNFGDVAPVGEGVSEMRIHYGPGYRLYFVQHERIVTVLLCGGNKSTQRRDIMVAKQLAKEI